MDISIAYRVVQEMRYDCSILMFDVGSRVEVGGGISKVGSLSTPYREEGQYPEQYCMTGETVLSGGFNQ